FHLRCRHAMVSNSGEDAGLVGAGWTTMPIVGAHAGLFPLAADHSALLHWTPVRGDSRRDLYAKTLALCGLGLLAGTGALVDYWPVGMKLPLAVTDPAVRPSPPAFLPAVPSAEAVLLASENAEAVETSTTRR